MDTIYTKNAPNAIGPYSQAVKIGDMLYTSGQIAINPATGNVEAADIVGQSKQVMANLKAVLEAAGNPYLPAAGVFRAIPHKDCATDASSNFSSDETKSGVNT